jgi:integrase
VDFEQNCIRIVRKEAAGNLASWEPKDHEHRLLPAPGPAMQALADLQQSCAEGCPYVFLSGDRLQRIQDAKKSGRWSGRQLVLNNLHRQFKAIRKKAGVAEVTFHDLRRTCITNWAKHLPIHVVQQLAGHGDINTTRKYYLSVQVDDLEKARQVQLQILADNPTDQEMTNSAGKTPFAGRPTKKASHASD